MSFSSFAFSLSLNAFLSDFLTVNFTVIEGDILVDQFGQMEPANRFHRLEVHLLVSRISRDLL